MFPEIIPARQVRGAIDGFVDHLVTNYADTLETLSQPVLHALVWLEQLLRSSPWWAVVAVTIAIAWGVSRRIGLSLAMGALLCVIGVLGLWDAGMQTLALMIMAAGLSVLIGIPLGVLMARINWLRSGMLPVLDVMQTMPSFVYLIPVVMLLGIGRVPGLIAVVIYAIPPVIRFTNLGIRLVDKDLLEAADAFGSSAWQKMRQVQLPLALPTIMAGVNQTIMLSLAMVVIAAMIGVQGLGQPVLRAISNQYFTMGILNGMAIVGIAIIFDRVSQAYGKRLQKHLEVKHG